ncbi:THUMP-like domain-containing protein [Tenacibaculum sp. 190524A05c]|uniref:THUMP-like domain-containing protein n=1 Tax=Tenacibaculum platacis TaxID=3137852 RepID=UPI0032B1F69E
MNLKILNTEVQSFIDSNLNEDISKILFKGSPFDEISVQELANQIVAKKKSQHKLPSWFNTEDIYYPPKVSIEQTSSEITAKYKANLVKGETLIDISGGFGVDSYYFSKNVNSVIHCEINEELSTIVNHNYKKLEANNIQTKACNGIEYLKSNNTDHFDWIYTDPSRRDDSKNKVFLLKDCSPNIPEEIDILFSKSDNILIKVSPILDISNTIRELKFTKEVHVVAINNEVKELLFILKKDHKEETLLKTVNFKKDTIEEFNFYLHSNQLDEPKYSLPLKYLYEPNAAILKAGGFKEITQQFDVNKLHQHSHLYTSEDLVTFPGRTFIIDKVIPYNKKEIKKNIPDKKANITIRNFPKTVAQIRKETKIKDGGNLFLFLTTLENNSKVMIISHKIH